jgi:hypothetical protein
MNESVLKPAAALIKPERKLFAMKIPNARLESPRRPLKRYAEPVPARLLFDHFELHR